MVNIKDNKGFISPTRDVVFKTMWIRGNEHIKKYLERMIEFSINKPLGEYTLDTNELGIVSYESIANIVDIILLSVDGLEKTNIEMNRIGESKLSIKKANNKSRVYLASLVDSFFDKMPKEMRYAIPIRVNQINFNTFYCPYDNEIERLDFYFKDDNKMVVDDYMQTHHLFLPQLKNLCYNKDEDVYKDFALLMANSYEEMEKYAKGNKEREEVVKFLKKLGKDGELMALIDREEYNQIILETEAHEKGIAEGFEQGIEKGIEKGIEQGIEQGIEKGINSHQREVILKLYTSKGKSILEISELLDLSKEEVSKIISEEKSI